MKGATLLELMLALLISTLILGSLTTLYLATQTVNQAQVALTTLQENARIARALLNFDIKMAGYAGCAKLRTDYPVNYSAVFSLTQTNKIQPYHHAAMKPGSMALTVRHADSKNAVLIKSMKNPVVLYASAEPRFFKGDVLYLSDCNNAEFFRVKELIRGNNGMQKILAEKPLQSLYAANAAVSYFNSNTYFIGQTTRRKVNGDVIYALYRQDIQLHKTELVAGVDDMQIKYGFLDHGQLSELAAEEVNDWSKVVGVAVTLTFDAASWQKKGYLYAALRTT